MCFNFQGFTQKQQLELKRKALKYTENKFKIKEKHIFLVIHTCHFNKLHSKLFIFSKKKKVLI